MARNETLVKLRNSTSSSRCLHCIYLLCCVAKRHRLLLFNRRNKRMATFTARRLMEIASDPVESNRLSRALHCLTRSLIRVYFDEKFRQWNPILCPRVMFGHESVDRIMSGRLIFLVSISHRYLCRVKFGERRARFFGYRSGLLNTKLITVFFFFF